MRASEDDASRDNVSLYRPEQAEQLILAQKTLPVRKRAQTMSRIAIFFAIICTAIFVTGIAPHAVNVAAWVACLLFVGAAAAIDNLRRELLRLR